MGLDAYIKDKEGVEQLYQRGNVLLYNLIELFEHGEIMYTDIEITPYKFRALLDMFTGLVHANTGGDVHYIGCDAHYTLSKDENIHEYYPATLEAFACISRELNMNGVCYYNGNG